MRIFRSWRRSAATRRSSGLLGTVLGIIKAAHEMNVAAGQDNPSAVMSGVFEALVATAVGLFVAIPAVVAYNLFERKVRTRLAQVDSLAHLVLANLPLDVPAGRTGADRPRRRGAPDGRQHFDRARRTKTKPRR